MRRFPKEEPRAYPVPSSSGGSAVDTAFVQVMDTDQASNVPVDTGSLGDTGTGLTAGEFRIVWTAHAVIVDGYREALLRWTKNLRALFPSFDPAIHGLRVRQSWRSPGQFPHASGTDTGAGNFCGVGDRGTGDLANLMAACSGKYISGAAGTSFTAAHLGATGTVLINTYEWFPTVGGLWSPRQSAFWENESALGIVSIQLLGTNQATGWQTDITQWCLHFGAFHETALSNAGKDDQFTIHAAMFERGAFFP
jgi:hypothetical protein